VKGAAARTRSHRSRGGERASRHPAAGWRTDGALPPYLDLLAARGIGSAVLLPIFPANRLAGILVLGYAGRPTASADDLERVRQLADQVGVALANARLIEDLDNLNWAP